VVVPAKSGSVSRPAETFIVYDNTIQTQSKAEFYIYTLNIYNYAFCRSRPAAGKPTLNFDKPITISSQLRFKIKASQSTTGGTDS